MFLLIVACRLLNESNDMIHTPYFRNIICVYCFPLNAAALCRLLYFVILDENRKLVAISVRFKIEINFCSSFLLLEQTIITFPIK